MRSVLSSPLTRPARLSLLLAACLFTTLPGAAAYAQSAAPGAPGAAAGDKAPEVPYSPAETALFMVDHLHNLSAKGATLTYHFTKTGTFETGYEDRVTIEVGAPDSKAEGGRQAKLDFLTGDHHVDLPVVEGAKGNPVILGFLERDVREMKRITSGQPNYYRKRVRMALVEAHDLKPVTVRWNGKDVKGQELTIEPYRDDPARARFTRYANKSYTFTLSDAVPGHVYSIRTVMHDGDMKGKTMIEETLTLTEAKP